MQPRARSRLLRCGGGLLIFNLQLLSETSLDFLDTLEQPTRPATAASHYRILEALPLLPWA
jgi:hypothetical protein